MTLCGFNEITGKDELYEGMKERNVLYNDTLNTFYLWLYGIGCMINDRSDSEKRNPLPPLHGQHQGETG